MLATVKRDHRSVGLGGAADRLVQVVLGLASPARGPLDTGEQLARERGPGPLLCALFGVGDGGDGGGPRRRRQ